MQTKCSSACVRSKQQTKCSSTVDGGKQLATSSSAGVRSKQQTKCRSAVDGGKKQDMSSSAAVRSKQQATFSSAGGKTNSILWLCACLLALSVIFLVPPAPPLVSLS